MELQCPFGVKGEIFEISAVSDFDGEQLDGEQHRSLWA